MPAMEAFGGLAQSKGRALSARNALNAGEAGALCEQVCQGRLAALQGDYARQVEQWLRTAARKHIIRNAPAREAAEPKEGDPAWARRAWEEGKLQVLELGPELRSELGEIVDWLLAEPQRQLSKVSYAQALDGSKAWHAKMRKKANVEEDWAGRRALAKAPDGFEWAEIFSRKALDREGRLMQHCVGSYADSVDAGACKIFSLRDAQNKPVLTVECNPAKDGAGKPDWKEGFRIAQVKAFANAFAGPERAGALDVLVKELPKALKAPLLGVEDIGAVGCVYNQEDGRLVPFEELPEGYEIEEAMVTFSGRAPEKFSHLKFKRLNFRGLDLGKIAEGLIRAEELHLAACRGSGKISCAGSVSALGIDGVARLEIASGGSVSLDSVNIAGTGEGDPVGLCEKQRALARLTPAGGKRLPSVKIASAGRIAAADCAFSELEIGRDPNAPAKEGEMLPVELSRCWVGKLESSALLDLEASDCRFAQYSEEGIGKALLWRCMADRAGPMERTSAVSSGQGRGQLEAGGGESALGAADRRNLCALMARALKIDEQCVSSLSQASARARNSSPKNGKARLAKIAGKLMALSGFMVHSAAGSEAPAAALGWLFFPAQGLFELVASKSEADWQVALRMEQAAGRLGSESEREGDALLALPVAGQDVLDKARLRSGWMAPADPHEAAEGLGLKMRGLGAGELDELMDKCAQMYSGEDCKPPSAKEARMAEEARAGLQFMVSEGVWADAYGLLDQSRDWIAKEETWNRIGEWLDLGIDDRAAAKLALLVAAKRAALGKPVKMRRAISAKHGAASFGEAWAMDAGLAAEAAASACAFGARIVALSEDPLGADARESIARLCSDFVCEALGADSGPAKEAASEFCSQALRRLETGELKGPMAEGLPESLKAQMAGNPAGGAQWITEGEAGILAGWLSENGVQWSMAKMPQGGPEIGSFEELKLELAKCFSGGDALAAARGFMLGEFGKIYRSSQAGFKKHDSEAYLNALEESGGISALVRLLDADVDGAEALALAVAPVAYEGYSNKAAFGPGHAEAAAAGSAGDAWGKGVFSAANLEKLAQEVQGAGSPRELLEAASPEQIVLCMDMEFRKGLAMKISQDKGFTMEARRRLIDGLTCAGRRKAQGLAR